jgi:hypothetical protein
MLASGRRGTLLVLVGAGLASVALTVGVAVRAPAPVAASARATSAPTGTSQAGDDPGQQGGEAPPHDDAGQPVSTSSSPVPVVNFNAVAGPACPVDAAKNVRISAGWEVVPGDSWTGDGCGDRFLYSAPDDPNFVQWRFMLAGEAMRTCRVAIFVPDSPLASDKVWYGVADRFENPDYRVGGFTLDQKANRGKWVNGAAVRVRGAALMVNVEGRQNMTGVAAAAVRVTCRE